MSINIHETDNLTIVAGLGEDINSGYKEQDSFESTTEKTIRLHISILVNGKIKNIFQQYEIVKQESDTSSSPDIYKLKQYNGFNTLCEILRDLGYETTGFYPMLEKALDRLFNR